MVEDILGLVWGISFWTKYEPTYPHAFCTLCIVSFVLSTLASFAYWFTVKTSLNSCCCDLQTTPLDRANATDGVNVVRTTCRQKLALCRSLLSRVTQISAWCIITRTSCNEQHTRIIASYYTCSGQH